MALRPLIPRPCLSSLATRRALTSRLESTVGNKAHEKYTRRYGSQAASRNLPLRLMPLGGSGTYGVGSSDGNGYRKFLQDMLNANGFQVRMVGSRKSGSMDNNDNEGWRGFRLDQIETKAKRFIATEKPDLFTINAGSNDCLQDFQLDGFVRRMDNMIEYLWQTCPPSTVILSTLLVNADETVNTRVLHVNSQLRDLVEQKAAEQRRIVLADMYSGEGPQLSDLIDDGTHPNDEGYKKMAQIWFRAIQEAHKKRFIG